ncbi:MAG: serine hydrolase domain-containing protein [Solirubrobacteraceae bacterium]
MVAAARRPSPRTIVRLAVTLAATAVIALGAVIVTELMGSGGHALAHPPAPRSTSALRAVLDSALRTARADVHAPAATAAVVACGRVVWAGATGVLDVRSKRPATNGSLFVLNSAVKSVVATMIMQEVQDGHLSLGTRLSKFYPQLPNADRISVRMLLDMTSGLPDYLDNHRIEWTIRHRPRHHWTIDQILTGLGTGLGAPAFPPGREYQYSDTNYIVLGGILERVIHSSIQRGFQRLIARPLGITSATFVPTPPAKSHLAHPYVLYGNGFLADQWISHFGISTAVWGPVFTDGGMAGSTLDLAKFGNALLGGRLVGVAAVRQITHLISGNYGFGVRGRSFDGHLWLGQAGIFGGFQAQGWSDPGRQLTIAVAINVQQPGDGLTSNRMWRLIARAYDQQSLPTASCGAPRPQ